MWRDQVREDLQVSQAGEFGVDELDESVHPVHVQARDLGSEWAEGPEPRVLADHVPFLADQGVVQDLPVGQVAEDAEEDLKDKQERETKKGALISCHQLPDGPKWKKG